MSFCRLANKRVHNVINDEINGMSLQYKRKGGERLSVKTA